MEKDKKEVKKFRIINKTKDGLIIILYGKKTNLTWEEFKQDYVLCEDKMTCCFNEKALEKLDQANELITQGTMAVLAINSPKAERDPQWKLTNLSVLGSVSQKLTELLGVNIDEVRNLIQQRLDILRGANTGNPKRKGGKKFKKEATEEQPRESKEHKDRSYGTTLKLGDLPAMQELKKKYGL